MSDVIITTGIFQNGVVIPKIRPRFEIKKILLTFWPKTTDQTITKKAALKKIIDGRLQVSEDWIKNKQQVGNLHQPY